MVYLIAVKFNSQMLVPHEMIFCLSSAGSPWDDLLRDLPHFFLGAQSCSSVRPSWLATQETTREERCLQTEED